MKERKNIRREEEGMKEKRKKEGWKERKKGRKKQGT